MNMKLSQNKSHNGETKVTKPEGEIKMFKKKVKVNKETTVCCLDLHVTFSVCVCVQPDAVELPGGVAELDSDMADITQSFPTESMLGDDDLDRSAERLGGPGPAESDGVSASGRMASSLGINPHTLQVDTPASQEVTGRINKVLNVVFSLQIMKASLFAEEEEEDMLEDQRVTKVDVSSPRIVVPGTPSRPSGTKPLPTSCFNQCLALGRLSGGRYYKQKHSDEDEGIINRSIVMKVL